MDSSPTATFRRRRANNPYDHLPISNPHKRTRPIPFFSYPASEDATSSDDDEIIFTPPDTLPWRGSDSDSGDKKKPSPGQDKTFGSFTAPFGSLPTPFQYLGRCLAVLNDDTYLVLSIVLAGLVYTLQDLLFKFMAANRFAWPCDGTLWQACTYGIVMHLVKNLWILASLLMLGLWMRSQSEEVKSKCSRIEVPRSIPTLAPQPRVEFIHEQPVEETDLAESDSWSNFGYDTDDDIEDHDQDGDCDRDHDDHHDCDERISRCSETKSENQRLREYIEVLQSHLVTAGGELPPFPAIPASEDMFSHPCYQSSLADNDALRTHIINLQARLLAACVEREPTATFLLNHILPDAKLLGNCLTFATLCSIGYALLSIVQQYLSLQDPLTIHLIKCYAQTAIPIVSFWLMEKAERKIERAKATLENSHPNPASTDNGNQQQIVSRAWEVLWVLAIPGLLFDLWHFNKNASTIRLGGTPTSIYGCYFLGYLFFSCLQVITGELADDPTKLEKIIKKARELERKSKERKASEKVQKELASRDDQRSSDYKSTNTFWKSCRALTATKAEKSGKTQGPEQCQRGPRATTKLISMCGKHAAHFYTTVALAVNGIFITLLVNELSNREHAQPSQIMTALKKALFGQNSSQETLPTPQVNNNIPKRFLEVYSVFIEHMPLSSTGSWPSGWYMGDGIEQNPAPAGYTWSSSDLRMVLGSLAVATTLTVLNFRWAANTRKKASAKSEINTGWCPCSGCQS